MLKALANFVDLTQNGNVAQAARRHALSRSAFYARIAKLEKEFNVPLIAHSQKQKKLKLTPAGQLLSEYAVHLLDYYAAIKNDIANCHNDIKGTITIGATPLITDCFLTDILAKFKQKYRNIRVTGTTDTQGNLIKMLEEKSIDVALLEGPLPKIGLHRKPFHIENFKVVQAYESLLGKNHVYSPQTTWLVCRFGIQKEIWQNYMSSYANCQPKHVIYMNSIYAVKQAVQKGLGIALLPEKFITASLKNKELSFIDNVKTPTCRFTYVRGKGTQETKAFGNVVEELSL